MATRFGCSACGTGVLRPVEPLADPSRLNLREGEAAVPQGWLLVADVDWAHHGGGNVLDLADLLLTRAHPDWPRRQGCCGSDGMNGKIVLCEQGHEVGTACSDCWISHALVLDSGAVVRKDLSVGA